ncbi:UNVERIFIED_CONTAM: hypothetical protein K2H54_012628 [Gekko kuhli]
MAQPWVVLGTETASPHLGSPWCPVRPCARNPWCPATERGGLPEASGAAFCSARLLVCPASALATLALQVSSIDSQEVGMSGAFPSMHRRRIVVYLPTCQPEDPGTRDASVQVGVTCEDKATQWEEREAADPSLDKSLGAYSKSLPQSRSLNSLGFAGNGEDDFLGHSNGHSQRPGTTPKPARSRVAKLGIRPKAPWVSTPTILPQDVGPPQRDASVQAGVTYEDKATQWEESVEADPSLDKPSGANSRVRVNPLDRNREFCSEVSSIDSQDRGGQGTEHPQTPGAPAGGSSAPESRCHQEDGMSVAFRPVRHIVIFLPTCQPEDPGTRDASVQVGVTCEDKATQWEEREEADPSLDKPSGANTTVSSIDSQDRGGQGTEHPQTPGAPEEGGSSAPESRCHQDSGVSVAVRPVRHIIIYLPTCQPEDPRSRDASVQVGVTCEDKATQWEEREEADPSLDKPSGVNSKVSSIDSQEAGMSGAFPSMHRRHIVVYLPTCLPEEDPGTRDASVQVSSIDSQDRGGQGPEHPQTPGSPAGGSSAPESSCHQDDGMSVALRPVWNVIIYLSTCQQEDPGTRDASVQVGVTCEDKATQWEEREEADPSLDKSSGANTTGSRKWWPRTMKKGPYFLSDTCWETRRIVIYLPTCQPEAPGSRDASVQVGVTCEDKATQWEEREEADPSLDKPSGANTTVSSIDSQEADMSGAFPSKYRRHIVVYLPTCLPEEDPGTRDASVQVGVTCEDKATQWEENVQADPSLDKSLGAYSKLFRDRLLLDAGALFSPIHSSLSLKSVEFGDQLPTGPGIIPPGRHPPAAEGPPGILPASP